MRYSSNHKESTRKRLLDVGAALAKEQGFGTTGVDGLMAAAGLTSGAFYSHFNSKSELLEAIVENDLNRSLQLFANKTDAQFLSALGSYLSLAHVERPGQGCSATALSVEVGRSNAETKKVFEEHVLKLKDEFLKHASSPDHAWTVLAQAVGAIVVARAMESTHSRQELLDAVYRDAKSKVAGVR